MLWLLLEMILSRSLAVIIDIYSVNDTIMTIMIIVIIQYKAGGAATAGPTIAGPI